MKEATRPLTNEQSLWDYRLDVERLNLEPIKEEASDLYQSLKSFDSQLEVRAQELRKVRHDEYADQLQQIRGGIQFWMNNLAVSLIEYQDNPGFVDMEKTVRTPADENMLISLIRVKSFQQFLERVWFRVELDGVVLSMDDWKMPEVIFSK